MKKGLFLFLAVSLLCACAQKNTRTNSKPLIGSDRDDHGCIGSAGYTWSEVRGECVRLFEVGIAVTSIDDETVNAYIVLSPDSSKLELFLVDNNKILERDSESSDLIYKFAEGNISESVVCENNIWTIYINNEVKFRTVK